jgi:hypothetical protein
VIHLGVLSIIPEADRKHSVAINQGNLVAETFLLTKNRQNLRIKQLDEFALFSIFQLDMDIASDFQLVSRISLAKERSFRGHFWCGEGRGSTPRLKTYVVCFLYFKYTRQMGLSQAPLPAESPEIGLHRRRKARKSLTPLHPNLLLAPDRSFSVATFFGQSAGGELSIDAYEVPERS